MKLTLDFCMSFVDMPLARSLGDNNAGSNAVSHRRN